MIDSRSSEIEAMRSRYLRMSRHTHKRDECIALFEEIGGMAASAGAPAWTKFAEGMTAWVRGDLGTALELLEAAIVLDPEFAYAWNGKGNVLGDLKSHKEALAAYEKAIALDPEFAFPWYNKGSALDTLERYEEALAAYEKAIALDPKDATAWSNRGVTLGKEKRYDEALAAYDKAIALDPNHVLALRNKGIALRGRGLYDEALAASQAATEADPANAISHYSLGLGYWHLGKHRQASEAFRHAIKLGLESPTKKAAQAWVRRAERMTGSGSPEELDQRDRSSGDALVADLHEKLSRHMPIIQRKKAEFESQIAESIGRPRIVGSGAVDDMLLVLRDWNSYSPVLRRELRSQTGRGPVERLGGGYLLIWRGYGTVIDPGVDFVTQLYRKGLSIADVDAVIITHCHLDHTRDVESLVDLNYRYNRARGTKPDSEEFRQLRFLLCYTAFMKYGEHLKNSGCCRTPTQLERDGDAKRIGEYIDVRAVGAHHRDINGRNNEAVGLVFALADKCGRVVRVGFTSDTKWHDSLSKSFVDCDVLVSHLGTIEVEEDKAAVDAGPGVGKGAFLNRYLENHLGVKGCHRLLHDARPKIFVLGEFGEELVESRLQIVQILHGLKPKETHLVLGGDSNLAIGLEEGFSVYCSHPECLRSWARISLDRVHPVLGDDFLFQYICSEHSLIKTPLS